MSYSGIFDGAKKLMDAYENLNKPVNNIKHNSNIQIKIYLYHFKMF